MMPAIPNTWRAMRGTLVSVGILALLLTAPVLPAAAEAPAPTYDQAVGQLRLYVRYLNERDFGRAYRLRSTSLQQQRSFASFTAQFTNVASTDFVVLDTAATGDQTTVFLLLNSVFEDGTTRVLRGTYTMGFENGRTRIFNAVLFFA